MFSLFSSEKKKNPTYRKVNVFNLKENDVCFYNGHSAPFTVVEATESAKGVYYVEIKNAKSGKKYLFTDNTTVLVEVND
jgi:hypothetical protein